MSGINKVIQVGRVARDPEIRNTDKSKVASFTLAVSEKYKDSKGQMVESTEWVQCVIWGGLADVIEKYVSKGDLLYIEGKLKTRSWEKDGVTRYTTEVIGSQIQMLGSKQESKQKAEPTGPEYGDSDLPF